MVLTSGTETCPNRGTSSCSSAWRYSRSISPCRKITSSGARLKKSTPKSRPAPNGPPPNGTSRAFAALPITPAWESPSSRNLGVVVEYGVFTNKVLSGQGQGGGGAPRLDHVSGFKPGEKLLHDERHTLRRDFPLIGLVEGALERRAGDDFVGRKIIDVGQVFTQLPGDGAQYRFRVGRSTQRMLTGGGRGQWHWRNGEQQSQLRVHRTHQLQRLDHLPISVEKTEIAKTMNLRIEAAAHGARAHRIQQRGAAMLPGFGQTQGKHKHLGAADGRAYGRQRGIARGEQRLLTGKALRLDRWPKRIKKSPVMAPGFGRWRTHIQRPFEPLTEHRRRIQIAGAERKHPVVTGLIFRLRQISRSRLSIQPVHAPRHQRPANVLGKTGAGSDDDILAADLEFGCPQITDLRRGLVGDGSAPEGAGWQALIGIHGKIGRASCRERG